MFNLLTRLFLIGSLVFIQASRPDADENLALALMMILVTASFFREPWRRVNLSSLVAVFVFSAATLFASQSVVCRTSVVNIFAALLAIKAIGENFDMDLKSLSRWIFGFVVLTYALVIAQVLRIEPIYQPHWLEVAGSCALPWVLGCAIVLSIPFLMTIHPALCLLSLPLLWLSSSSACIAAGLIVIVFFLFHTNRKLAITGLVSAPLAILWVAFNPVQGFDENRLQVWKNGLSHFGNPLIGKGLGTWAHSAFYHAQGGNSPMWWRWAHNEYYQQGYEQGLVGLVLLLTACAYLYLMAKSKTIKAALVGLFLISAFHPVLHWGKLSLFAVVIAGIALAEGSKNERRI